MMGDRPLQHRPGLRLRQFETGKWNGRPVVLCGALFKVARAADYLLNHGLGDHIRICDDDLAGQEYRGIPIIAAPDLRRHRHDNLLMGSKVFYRRYMDHLDSMALSDWFFMNQLYTAPYERKAYENTMFEFLDRRKEHFIMPGLELVITQRCNLRCRHCANRMQYYADPVDYQEKDYIEAVSRLLKAVDGIADLKIIGGEPFLLPDKITAILEQFGASEQIFCIDIPTNGTLLLPEHVVCALRGCPKATVLPGDYGPASRRLTRLLAQLQEGGVAHVLYPRSLPWVNMGDLKLHNLPDQEIQAIYEQCRFRKSCPTLLGAKLYPCPGAGHGTALGAIPELEGEYVDLSEEGNLRQRLLHFFSRPTFFNACRYCLGGCSPTPRARQIPAPLPYERIAGAVPSGDADYGHAHSVLTKD